MGHFEFGHVLWMVTLVLYAYVGYQSILAMAGFHYLTRWRKARASHLIDLDALPPVTILIPAHNEGKVIERTVRAMLALHYPPGRLKVLVMDDASTDNTAQLLDRLAAKDPRVRVVHRGPEIGGRGKSAVLNHALTFIEDEYIVIYDADNCPSSDALLKLMGSFLERPEVGAVVGKFRTGNRNRNLLTKFINLEGLAYQSIIQAGRNQLFKIAMLTGTNYVIRKSVLEKIHGWDEEALTEDAELSARVYEAGYRIVYVPDSVSWEQEPETLREWIKQRTRWSRGNIYVIGKLLKMLPRATHKFIMLEMLFMLLLPFFLVYTLVVSQVSLAVALFNYSTMFPTVDHFDQWWLISIGLYTLQLGFALSFDDEHSLDNVSLGVISFFTYCQAWLIPLTLACHAEFIQRKSRSWDKTRRFDGAMDIRQTATLTAPRLHEPTQGEPARYRERA